MIYAGQLVGLFCSEIKMATTDWAYGLELGLQGTCKEFGMETSWKVTT
jgi:hypothetical protein